MLPADEVLLFRIKFILDDDLPATRHSHVFSTAIGFAIFPGGEKKGSRVDINNKEIMWL